MEGKQGWLIKRGQLRKNWLKRFFIVQNGIIRYFISPAEPIPKGQLSLLNATVKSERGNNTHKHVLSIKSAGRTLYCAAESKAEKEDWIDAFQSQARTLQTESPPKWRGGSKCERCHAEFTLTFRKHHCRGCGGLMCSKCLPFKIPLPRYGFAKPQLVCLPCYNAALHGVEKSPSISNFSERPAEPSVPETSAEEDTVTTLTDDAKTVTRAGQDDNSKNQYRDPVSAGVTPRASIDQKPRQSVKQSDANGDENTHPQHSGTKDAVHTDVKESNEEDGGKDAATGASSRKDSGAPGKVKEEGAVEPAAVEPDTSEENLPGSGVMSKATSRDSIIRPRLESTPEEKRLPHAELIQRLRAGIIAWKLPHSGNAKQTRVFVVLRDDGLYYLAWDSKKKEGKKPLFLLKGADVSKGQSKGLFQKRQKLKAKFAKQEHLSLTIEVHDRTIDLVCDSPGDLDVFTLCIPELQSLMV